MANETQTYELKIDTGEKEISHTRPLGTTGMEERANNFIANKDIYPSENAYEMVKSAAERVASELGFMESFTRSLVENRIVARKDLLDLRKSLEDKIDHAAQTMVGKDFYNAFIGNQGLKEKVEDPRNFKTLPQMASAHSVLQGIFEGEDQIGTGLAQKYAKLREKLEKGFDLKTADEKTENFEVKRLRETPQYLLTEQITDRSRFRQRDSLNFFEGAPELGRRPQFIISREITKTEPPNESFIKARFEAEQTDYYTPTSKGGAERTSSYRTVHRNLETGTEARGYFMSNEIPYQNTERTVEIGYIPTDKGLREVDYKDDTSDSILPNGQTSRFNYQTFTLRSAIGRISPDLGKPTDQEVITVEVKIDPKGKRTIAAERLVIADGAETTYNREGKEKVYFNRQTPQDRKINLREKLPSERAEEILRKRIQPVLERAKELLSQQPEWPYIEHPERAGTELNDYSQIDFEQIPKVLKDVEFVTPKIFEALKV